MGRMFSYFFVVILPEQCCEGAVHSVHVGGSVLHEAVGGPALASYTASLLQAPEESSHTTNIDFHQQ